MLGANYFGSGYFGSAYFGQKPVATENYSPAELEVPQTRIEIARLSPSFGVLTRVLDGGISLEGLTWREFEELLAEMLEKDGYTVELGRGTKDGGKDLMATKDLGPQGLYMAVWQAKNLKPANKVEVNVVRELAWAKSEFNASKGIVATTSYLTAGALALVKRDHYMLGKVDKDDLMKWLHDLSLRR